MPSPPISTIWLEDLKEINQQTNAKKTTETVLEETPEPQQILAC